MLDRPVGVPDRVEHALAGAHLHQLPHGSVRGRLDLPDRIGGDALQHDRAHLLAETLEAAEPVENALAPQKYVRVGRQLQIGLGQ